MKISKKLFKIISKYITDKMPLVIYWDYRDEISQEQVKKLLESTDNNYFDLEEEIFSQNIDYMSEEEVQFLKQVFEYFEDDIFNDLIHSGQYRNIKDKREYFELPDTQDELLESFYDLFRDLLYWDYDIKTLIKNSRLRLTLNINIGLESDNIQEYADIYELVKFFGINKDELDFLNIKHPPQKSPAKEYISLKSFKDLILNSCYGGQLVFLLSDLSYIISNRDKLSKRILVKKGTCLTIHDYWNGSSSIIVELEKDIVIDSKKYKYYFRVDGKYGVDDCCGLTYNCFSDGEISTC